MVVAELGPRSLMQHQPPGVADFLRLYGTICSVPAVAEVGTHVEAGMLHVWVRLTDDDDRYQNVIYDALRRYRVSESEDKVTVDLHIVFPDEDKSAFPPEAQIYFTRE